MDKFRQWLYGLITAALIGSGGWAWGYAFNTESRLSKLEVEFVNLKEGQKRIEDAIIRVENWTKSVAEREHNNGN